MSNYRSKEHRAKFLEEEEKFYLHKQSIRLSYVPALIIGSIVNEWPGFITPIALFSIIEMLNQAYVKCEIFTGIMRNIWCTMKKSKVEKLEKGKIVWDRFTYECHVHNRNVQLNNHSLLHAFEFRCQHHDILYLDEL